MRRTALTFGSISGAVGIAFMAVTIPLIEAKQLAKSDVLGYSAMLASALLVFFGIRSYRERVGGGWITFGRGFSVGLLVTAISCAFAVVAFEVVYFWLVPDFGETFSACMVERVRASGADQAQIDTVTEQSLALKRLYDNPWTNAVLTFATTFPVGLVAAAVSAAILRRRRSPR